jgi:hypothetical protein
MILKTKGLHILLLAFTITMMQQVKAQVKIGDANSPDPNAILDLTNGLDLGLLFDINSSIIDTAIAFPEGNIHYFGGNLFLSQNTNFPKWNVISPWIFDGVNENGVSYPLIGRSGVGIGVNTLDSDYNPASGPDNYATNLHIGFGNKEVLNGLVGNKSSAILIADDSTDIINPSSQNYLTMLMDNDEILVKTNIGTPASLKIQDHLNASVQIGQDISNTSDLNVFGKVKENGGYVQPSKSIIMWNGSSSDAALFEQSGPTEGLGLGEMYGWAICNGNNDTPDLSGKFIIGAGSRNEIVRTNNGSTTTGASSTYVVTDSIGASVVMQQANQVGVHNHGSSGLTHGNVSASANHNHHHHRSQEGGGGAIGNDGLENDGLTENPNDDYTGWAGSHSHTFSGSTATNSGTQQAMPNRPSYYVVVYLMKL